MIVITHAVNETGCGEPSHALSVTLKAGMGVSKRLLLSLRNFCPETDIKGGQEKKRVEGLWTSRRS